MCSLVLDLQPDVELESWTNASPHDNPRPCKFPTGQLPFKTTAPPPPPPRNNYTLDHYPPGQLSPRQLPPKNYPYNYATGNYPVRTFAPQDNCLPDNCASPGKLPPQGCSYHYIHIRNFHRFFFANGYLSSHSESEDYAN